MSMKGVCDLAENKATHHTLKDSIEKSNQNCLDLVKRITEEISFGTISIHIQDGRIVQVEKSQKYRI